jgi:hypothetical protein
MINMMKWHNNSIEDKNTMPFRRFSSCLSFFLAALILVLAAGRVPDARGELSRLQEYEIKAAYIYNFAKYVEWPADSFASESAPLILGILGDNPFGPHLEKIAGKSVRGRKLVIREINDYHNIVPCHLLYISTSEAKNLKEIASILAEQPVLTIADMKNFIVGDGMINLVVQKNKVRFIINPRKAKKQGLTISSLLLKLAIIDENER